LRSDRTHCSTRGPASRGPFHSGPDGTIIVRAKTKSILDMAGKLGPKGKHVTVAEMNPWR